MSNIEYRIFVVDFYRQAKWKKIITNIQSSMFDMDKITNGGNILKAK